MNLSLSRILVVACFCLMFHAQGTENQLDLFGSFGYSKTDSIYADYRVAQGYEFSAGKSGTSILDSRIGVHGKVNLFEGVQAVGQVLVRRNSIDEVQWTAPWAYLHWQPDVQYEVLLGRFRHSLFMITDEMDVGYAWPWVRPPVELYSLVGESTYIDGVKLRFRDTVGSYTAVFESHVGSLQLDRKPRLVVDNDKIYGVAFSLSNEVVTYRASLVQAHVSIEAPRLDPLIHLISQQNPAILLDYQLQDISPQRYLNLGMRYEDGQWLVLTEVARLWLKSRFLPNKWAYYFTVGRTFAAFTPFVSVANQQLTGFSAETRLTGIPAAAIRQFEQNSVSDQFAASFGVRWDFAAGMALKMQMEQIHQPAGSRGIQAQALPAGKDGYVLSSITLDWVF